MPKFLQGAVASGTKKFSLYDPSKNGGQAPLSSQYQSGRVPLPDFAFDALRLAHTVRDMSPIILGVTLPLPGTEEE